MNLRRAARVTGAGVALLAAIAVLLPSGSFAQTTGPGCCELSTSCADGPCPTGSGGLNRPNATCDSGRSCRPNANFTPAEAQSTAVNIPGGSVESGGVGTHPVMFVPNVSIPGSPFQQGQEVAISGTTIGDYVRSFYIWFAGAAGVLAVFMIMFGGFRWLTAAGNPGSIGEAKSTITGALIGLVLLLGSYVILSTISTDFVNFKDLRTLLDPVQANILVMAEHFSVGLIGNAGAVTQKEQFNNSACPTEKDMASGFDAFVTGYYTPSLNDAGGYGSPMCNLSMQCSCGQGATSSVPSCGPVKGYNKTWAPCLRDKIKESEVCSHTAWESVDKTTTHPPRELFTAASSKCFGFGTQFSIADGPADIQNRTWTVNDRGGDIKGTHFDLYTGNTNIIGNLAKSRAQGLRTKVRIKVVHYCAPYTSCAL